MSWAWQREEALSESLLSALLLSEAAMVSQKKKGGKKNLQDGADTGNGRGEE